jgi:hypothetical protein
MRVFFGAVKPVGRAYFATVDFARKKLARRW